MNNIALMLQEGDALTTRIQTVESEYAANIKIRGALETQIRSLQKEAEGMAEALDIATHAIEILRELSDEVVARAYAFLEETLNEALAKMFVNTTRRIKLNETLLRNQYPQLEIELYVTNGKKRTLKGDSGHGIAQIISLLSILALIVMTKSRRLLVIDEVMSGLSVRNRKIITEILWAFTEIGFQFIINEHGYVPERAMVYHLEMVGDVSNVKSAYISKSGVYLDNDNSYTASSIDSTYNYDFDDTQDAELFSGAENLGEAGGVNTGEIEQVFNAPASSIMAPIPPLPPTTIPNVQTPPLAPPMAPPMVQETSETRVISL